jgi:hypothetical protein
VVIRVILVNSEIRFKKFVRQNLIEKKIWTIFQNSTKHKRAFKIGKIYQCWFRTSLFALSFTRYLWK